MKIGSWNVRGLGSEVKKDKAALFISKFQLDFYCFQETNLRIFWIAMDVGCGGEGIFSGARRAQWGGREEFSPVGMKGDSSVVVRGMWEGRFL